MATTPLQTLRHCRRSPSEATSPGAINAKPGGSPSTATWSGTRALLVMDVICSACSTTREMSPRLPSRCCSEGQSLGPNRKTRPPPQSSSSIALEGQSNVTTKSRVCWCIGGVRRCRLLRPWRSSAGPPASGGAVGDGPHWEGGHAIYQFTYALCRLLLLDAIFLFFCDLLLQSPQL
jgi:hypothetical protein